VVKGRPAEADAQGVDNPLSSLRMNLRSR
jgi:hypothetical protein